MMIISGKKYLVDTNILVFAQDKKSSHFSQAAEILQEVNEEKFQCYITLQNLLEYSAVLTRFYKYSKSDVLSDLNIFISNPKFNLIYPTKKTVTILLQLMGDNPKLYIYDLFITAYMKDYGIKSIITDDEGFNEIKGIEIVNPF